MWSRCSNREGYDPKRKCFGESGMNQEAESANDSKAIGHPTL